MMSDKTAKRLADYILNNDEYVCLERGYSRNPARCVTLAFSAKESLLKPSMQAFGAILIF